MHGSDLDRGLPRLSKAIALAILLVAVSSLLAGSGCAGALPQPAGVTGEVASAPTQTAAVSLRAEAEATIAAAQSTIEAAEASSTPERTVVSTPTMPAVATVPLTSAPTPLASPSPTPEPRIVRVSPWTMERGNAQRSGWTADVGPESPELLWTFQAEGDLSDPVIASDGTIYVDAKDGTLYALDASGVEKWRLAIAGESWASPVLASDGTVYIARDSDVHAIGPDGTLRWTLSAEQRVSDVVVGADGTVYVSSNCLYAVEPDGQQRWVTSGEGCQGLGSLAVAPEGRIYGLSATSLFAFDSNGTLLWEKVTAPGARGGSTALMIGPQGDIYVNGITAASVGVALPIAPLDVLGPWGNYRFDAFRGEGFDGYIPAAPAIAPDGTVYLTWRSVGDSYVTADNVLTAGVGPWHLQARTPAAATLWSVALGGEPCSLPIVAGDGTAYLALCNGDLLAVRSEGTLQWRFTIGEAQDRGYGGVWKLALRTGVIVISSGNRLHAIGEVAPPPSPRAVPHATPQLTRTPPVLTATVCTQRPDAGKIAYVSTDNRELWTMNVDGSGKRRLVGLAELDYVYHPQWLPDGNRVVFTTHAHTYVINADGSDLTELPVNFETPIVSPDGTKITGSGNGLIVAQIDGGGTVDLTNCTESKPCSIGSPTWSPEGQWIAFNGGFLRRPGQIDAGLWVARTDGSELRQLLPSWNRTITPSWSPDGARIAFVSPPSIDATDGPYELYVMDSDSGDVVTKLPFTADTIYPSRPAWSPDGEKMAVAAIMADSESGYTIYVINADGTQPVAIGEGNEPAWQPNPCISGFPVLMTLSTPTSRPPIPTPTPRPPTPTPTPRPLNPLPNCPDPNARITYPRMGDWISGVVPFEGSANVPNFQYYKFEYRSVGEEAWRFLVRFDQPVTNGTLMEWHTHTVPKGEYELRLTVIDRSGNYPEPCVVRVRVY
ncbi:MAG: PQQ-binding-like beta-propeller repeat protein [Ardenticatenia bacterium]|nr:PQQ-binding-like beta-propeller repeat protein [Ardenticatenia bacterium]